MKENRFLQGFLLRILCAAAMLCCILLGGAATGEGQIALPKLDGYTQFRMNYLKPDDYDDGYTVGFRMAKGRLGVKGVMFDGLASYRILTEFFGSPSIPGQAATLNNLLDYFVTLNFSDNVKLRVGQFKVPFTRQYYQSASKHAFTDYALPVKNLKDGRDMGVEIFGEKISNGLIEYRICFFNGNGSNSTGNDNTDLEAAGRLALKWNGFNPYREGFQGEGAGVALGLSGYLNHLESGGTGQEKTGIGADATGGMRGLFLAGEYVAVKSSAQGNETSSGGFYVHAGYMVLGETLELLGRYASYDPDTDAGHDRKTEIRAGATFFHAGHKHKLTVEGGRIAEENGADAEKTSSFATVQYQFSFK